MKVKDLLQLDFDIKILITVNALVEERILQIDDELTAETLWTINSILKKTNFQKMPFVGFSLDLNMYKRNFHNWIEWDVFKLRILKDKAEIAFRGLKKLGQNRLYPMFGEYYGVNADNDPWENAQTFEEWAKENSMMYLFIQS